MSRTTLLSRPLDLVYFIYFTSHIFATIFIDLQALYPPALTPQFMKSALAWYLELSGDPLVKALFGQLGTPLDFIWFKTFGYLEFTFQLPTFFLASWGLWKGSSTIVVLILIYGASTATTTLPCITYLLALPTAETIKSGGVALITNWQRNFLLQCYLPYLIIPLIMTVDSAFRVLRLAQIGERAAKLEEEKSN